MNTELRPMIVTVTKGSSRSDRKPNQDGYQIPFLKSGYRVVLQEL